MFFFIEIQLYASTRLWRNPPLPPAFVKGLVDESNLKTKTSYCDVKNLTTWLVAVVRPFGGVLTRYGKQADRYLLVFTTEKQLNAFLLASSAVFKEVPVVQVQRIVSKTSSYRFDDYLKLLPCFHSSQSISSFLPLNLGQRVGQLTNSRLFFFASLHRILTLKG